MLELLIIIGLLSLGFGVFRGFVKVLFAIFILGLCFYIAVPLFFIGLIAVGVLGLRAWIA